ncbi:MAG: hypothetical protein ACLS9K_07120 [Lachnospira eligens]
MYVVYAGDTPIAKVELESAGKNAHKFNKWTLGTISFGDFTKNLAEVKITAPTGADVYINGVQVTDTYKTESKLSLHLVCMYQIMLRYQLMMCMM